MPPERRGLPAGRRDEERHPGGDAGDGPSIDARIVYGPGRGHCWTGISPAEMLREMAAQVESAGR